jgi:CBS domain-containing protein
MQVKEIMDQKVARIGVSTSMQVAAELLVLTQASDLIVVNQAGDFVGVVSEGDLLRLLMPDYDEVVKAGGSLQDAFRFFLENGQDLAQQPITRLIIAHPIAVSPEDELLKVATIMIEKMIRRLPVVADGKFLGTVSRADIAWAILSKNSGKS